MDGSDTDEASGATTYEVDAEPDGQFLVEELDPGRYDLTVSAEGLEEARLASVPSDAVGIHLTLARPPVLIGAIGGGQTACHGMHVLAEQQDTTDEQDVDDDCAFAFENLHRGTPAHLNDPRPDHHHGERTADVPAEGDPPPFCLDPPCAFLPSALVVLFADSEGFLASDVTLSWDVATSEDGGYGGIRMGTSSAVIAGLTAGAQVHLRAGDDDHTVESDVIVPFGIAEVVLTVPADEETAED